MLACFDVHLHITDYATYILSSHRQHHCELTNTLACHKLHTYQRTLCKISPYVNRTAYSYEQSSTPSGQYVNTEKVGKIIVELANTLAKEGATQDELDRCLKPKFGLLEKSLRQNSYWLNTVMDRAQAFPDKVEASRTRDADYASITLEEINSLAKKFCVKENSARISISPSK